MNTSEALAVLGSTSLAVAGNDPHGTGYPQKHLDRGISYSALKKLMIAPAIYEYQYIQGNWQATTDAMMVGRAVDILTLQPERFDKEFVIVPEGVDKRSKAGKAVFAELEEDGRDLIRHKQLVLAQGCARSARSRRISPDGPTLEELLARDDTTVQKKFAWSIQPVQGERWVKCQGIVDVVAAGGKILIDLKKVGQQGDAAPQNIGRTIGKFGYDIQAAMYMDGARAEGLEPEQYLIWAVEEKPPHLCAVHPIGDETLSWGNHAYRHAAWLWQTCVDSGKWPGYELALKQTELPPWILRERGNIREGE